MEGWLNYNHLRYFWEAARAGTITAAAARLKLAQPTVSTQIRELESQLGQRLFERRSRGLQLTRAGRRAYHYAEQIFGLGSELVSGFDPRQPSGRQTLRIGVSDALPKLVVAEVVRPLLDRSPPIRVVCHEDKSTRLIAELGLRGYDVVLADEPVAPSTHANALNHALGSSPITFFGTPELCRRLRDGFPHSLDGAPVVLPTHNTTVRRALDQWLLDIDIRPDVVGEFEDSALLKALGATGAGAFPVPTVVGGAVSARYGVEPIGQLEGVREPLYGITLRGGGVSEAADLLLERGRALMAPYASPSS